MVAEGTLIWSGCPRIAGPHRGRVRIPLELYARASGRVSLLPSIGTVRGHSTVERTIHLLNYIPNYVL